MHAARWWIVPAGVALALATAVFAPAGATSRPADRPTTRSVWAPVPLTPKVSTLPGTGELLAVSCVSATDCVVAGDGASDVGVVEQLVAGKHAKPVRMKQANSELFAISCPSAAACVVAGDATITVKVGGTNVPRVVGLLAEFSRGAIRDVTVISSVTSFRAVACATTKRCLATGYTSSPASGVVTDVHLSGSTLHATTGFLSDVGGLEAVTCPTAKRCVAAGYASAGAAVVVFNGEQASTPVVTTLPAYGGDEGIACTAATTCAAVGGIETDPDEFTYEGYAEALTPAGAAAGKVETLPATEQLFAVAALDARHDVAVGYAPGGNPIADLVTDGVAAVRPAGISAVGYLQGVACPTTTLCVAVGFTATSSVRVGDVARLGYENLPGTPRLAVSSSTTTALDLRLVPPANDGGAKLTGYELVVATCRAHHAGCAVTSTRTLELAATSTATLAGLRAATTYRLTVAARNAVGTGPASPPLAATTR